MIFPTQAVGLRGSDGCQMAAALSCSKLTTSSQGFRVEAQTALSLASACRSEAGARSLPGARSLARVRIGWQIGEILVPLQDDFDRKTLQRGRCDAATRHPELAEQEAALLRVDPLAPLPQNR